jgi:Flp pilus assembly protein protease CpaA
MQPFVYSVFSLVVSVIATLLVAGLTGIIAVLLMNRRPAPLLTGQEPEADRSEKRGAPNPRASSAEPTFSAALRTS